jgi:hypothetical protein
MKNVCYITKQYSYKPEFHIQSQEPSTNNVHDLRSGRKSRDPVFHDGKKLGLYMYDSDNPVLIVDAVNKPVCFRDQRSPTWGRLADHLCEVAVQAPDFHLQVVFYVCTSISTKPKGKKRGYQNQTDVCLFFSFIKVP